MLLPATSLTAYDTPPLDVTLTWIDHSYLENGYRIERSADGGSHWSTVGSSLSPIFTFRDTEIEGSTPYRYRVRPYAGGMNGPASQEAFIDTPEDADHDGLADALEAAFGSDPTLRSTAGDEVPDGWRYRYQFPPADAFPLAQDTDLDGVPDIWEYRLNSHPREPDGHLDFDGDGLPNSWELAYGLDPKIASASADSDSDGLNDADEFRSGSNPMVADTDGDGVNDGPDGWPLNPDLAPPRLPETPRLPQSSSGRHRPHLLACGNLWR